MIRNQWYAILPSRLLRPGKLLAVRRLGLDLVLFRNGRGEPGCVVDRCSHRGAALSAGELDGDCVRCPFHGIRFDTAGRCRFIPANGRADTADMSRYNVQSFAVREAHGILYLWYGDPAKAEGDPPFFDDRLAPGTVYSEIADPWPTHYSRAIENQLDVIHLPFVHHNTIGRGNRTLVNGPRAEFVDGELRTSADNDVDRGQAPRPPQQCAVSPDLYLAFRFPNVWMNHISDRIRVVIYFAPVDDENTILYIRFYCRATGFRPLDALVAWFGRFGNRTIERQDRRVVITQRPKASSLRGGEKLLTGDGPVILYRKRREELKERALGE